MAWPQDIMVKNSICHGRVAGIGKWDVRFLKVAYFRAHRTGPLACLSQSSVGYGWIRDLVTSCWRLDCILCL